MIHYLNVKIMVIPKGDLTEGLKPHLVEKFGDMAGTQSTIFFLQDLIDKLKRDSETSVALLSDVFAEFENEVPHELPDPCY